MKPEALPWKRHQTHGYVFRRMQGMPERPGAAGRWFITPHAVRAFQAHAASAQDMSFNQAMGAIIREIEDAHFVKALDTGMQLWRGPKPRRLRYLVTVGDGRGLPVLVTVRPAFDVERAVRGWCRDAYAVQNGQVDAR